MDFYKILQQIMDEKDYSVADVARLCDLSDSTVRSIVFRKQKNVALEIAFKLSHGLGVSLERLNGLSEESPPQNPDQKLDDSQVAWKKYKSLSSANQAKLDELLDLFLNAQDKS